MTDETTGEIELVYFAWVRERLGRAAERLALPGDVDSVRRLLDWLAGIDADHAAALAARDRLVVAVNRERVGPDHPIRPGDEIAVFPPVTGG